MRVMAMADESTVNRGRFVAEPSFSERTMAACQYVSKMDPASVAWLYRKPFRPGSHAGFLSELYSVLNLLQVLDLNEGQGVLEIGSGPGWVTEILALLGVNVTCVEPAADMIDIARERLASTFQHHRIANPPQIEFIQSALEEAHLPLETFDAAIFHEALHHVLDERACLMSTFDSLKKGGLIAICEWCWTPGNYAIESSLRSEMERFGTLESPFTQEYLDRIVKEVGFTNVTRYHAINGFIPQQLGKSTIEALAQAPAARTNNLTAMKPYGVPTSREAHTIGAGDVVISARDIAWLDEGRAVRMNISVANCGSALLLNSGIGGVTLSLCSGGIGETGFVEAGRVPLPKRLLPGDEVTFDARFIMASAANARGWRLEMVAEQVAWLDLRSKPKIEKEDA